MEKRRRTYTPNEKFGLIDVVGLEKMLGISRSSLYKMTMRNELPFYKVGGKLLFKVEQITAWLEDKKVSG